MRLHLAFILPEYILTPEDTDSGVYYFLEEIGKDVEEVFGLA
jgi:hypothetical protein